MNSEENKYTKKICIAMNNTDLISDESIECDAAIRSVLKSANMINFTSEKPFENFEEKLETEITEASESDDFDIRKFIREFAEKHNYEVTDIAADATVCVIKYGCENQMSITIDKQNSSLLK